MHSIERNESGTWKSPPWTARQESIDIGGNQTISMDVSMAKKHSATKHTVLQSKHMIGETQCSDCTGSTLQSSRSR